MGVFDYVSLGLAAGGVHADAVKGSFSVTIGDVLQSMMLGGRQTHIFGQNLQFVADPNEILGAILHSFPLVSALALGTEGNASFNFGHNVSATYGGPQYTIQRCSHTKYIYKAGLLGLKGTKVESRSATQLGETVGACPTDALYAGLVIALSAVALAAAFALDLTIHLKYPEFGTPVQPKETETETTSPSTGKTTTTTVLTPGTEGPEKIPEILKDVCWGVTSRLFAVLVWLEGHYLDVRLQWFSARESERIDKLAGEKYAELLAQKWDDLLTEAEWAAKCEKVALQQTKYGLQFLDNYEATVAAALK